MIVLGQETGRSGRPHRFVRTSAAVVAGRARVCARAAYSVALVLILVSPIRAQDPARTATIYVQGFEQTGATSHGTFGEDLGDPLLDQLANLAGMPVADGAATLRANVAAMTSYYGDTPPAWYTSAQRARLEQVTAEWGGGVPRYAQIIADYAGDVMRRSGASQINFVSASFGSLIVRWLIEKDVNGLASNRRITRWLNVEGVLSGNWAASRDRLVGYVEAVDPLPVDVAHMDYDWVDANLHRPRTQADHPNYAGILIGQIVSTDDDYNRAALSSLMRSFNEWMPNDGVQAVADAIFQDVTARSRLAGRTPTLGWFRNDHFGIKQARGAWAQIATFLTQRRRVTVTMTSARIADLKEPDQWYWDWRPAEIVLESRVYSPAFASRWGIGDAVSTREKEGAVAPLRRYQSKGETQSFTQVLFDDMVLDEERELRLVLRAEEIDYDWRYGIFETAQQPSYDDLGSGALTVATTQPGTYPFQTGSWSCTVEVSVFDYPFATPVSVPGATRVVSRPTLRISPNPHGALATVTLEGALPSAEGEPATLDVLDAAGRRVRRMTGDVRDGFRWDGRDDAATPLPAGLYLLRVTTPRGVWTGRSALLHR